MIPLWSVILAVAGVWVHVLLQPRASARASQAGHAAHAPDYELYHWHNAGQLYASDWLRKPRCEAAQYAGVSVDACCGGDAGRDWGGVVYFLLRQPITIRCPSCKTELTAGVHFCRSAVPGGPSVRPVLPRGADDRRVLPAMRAQRIRRRWAVPAARLQRQLECSCKLSCWTIISLPSTFKG